jgi:hypothetical protein
MKRMLLLWCGIGAAVLSSRPALACSCAPPATGELFASSATVFLATANQVTFIDQDQPEIEPRIEVRFAIEKSWKGRPAKKLKTVFNKSSCNGFAFERTKRYLVFSTSQGGAIHVGPCSVFADPTQIAVRSAELDALDP